MFERSAIEVLPKTQTVKEAMTILRLQWDATWHIIEPAVARGKARKEPSLLPRIGIDEKAVAKGRKYVSILYNLDNSTVEAIEEGHGKFHIMKMANDAVDKVRRGKHKQLLKDGDDRLTNAVAEGINSKIMSIKRRAGGYRNIENFKTAVLFYCGGLDLAPPIMPNGRTYFALRSECSYTSQRG